jgi:anti-sigma B factor antagonist
MNFDIKTEQLGDDAYVISLAGEVDLYTAPEFKQQLLEVIGQGGKQVIVDFSDTTFIDSTRDEAVSKLKAADTPPA